MSLEKLRADFPMLRGPNPPVYLDNAASSLTPTPVLDAVEDYYSNFRANIHRGLHKPSEDATRAFEQAHQKVESFVGAPKDTLVFTRNTTESINLVMNSLDRLDHFKTGTNIVLTDFEHHANLVPWQFVAKKNKLELRFANRLSDFTLDLSDLEKKIDSNTRLVALPHAANTTGAISDVKKASDLAHRAGAVCLVDGAQSAPHVPVDVKRLGCDFFAFSSHKMCGPTGVGGLFGSREWLENMPPFLFGGDMIRSVSYESSTWNTLPYKFEAGTPAIGEGIGFGAAAEYLKKTGAENIVSAEHRLLDYALKRVSEFSGVRVIGPMDPKKQVGTLLFEVGGVSAHDVAMVLSETGRVCIRSGHHCAHPFVNQINPAGLCRASFSFYNTRDEIDVFANALSDVVRTFR